MYHHRIQREVYLSIFALLAKLCSHPSAKQKRESRLVTQELHGIPGRKSRTTSDHCHKLVGWTARPLSFGCHVLIAWCCQRQRDENDISQQPAQKQTSCTTVSILERVNLEKLTEEDAGKTDAFLKALICIFERLCLTELFINECNEQL